MMKTFNYFYETKAIGFLEVSSVGNCSILAYNDSGSLYCLSIKTNLGISTIKQFGPIDTQTGTIEKFFNYNQKSIEYNEKKLNNIIDKFLNDSTYMITQAFETDTCDNYIPNIKEL